MSGDQEPLSVDVSVVVGANPELIIGCLESFNAYVPENVTVCYFVTCNQCGSEVPGRLRAQFSSFQLHIIENPVPRGFASNHNVVLEQSRADYIFVLNDDLVFLPGSIEKLLAFMQQGENRTVGVVSPKLLNPDGSLQPSTYSFPTVLTAFLNVSGIRKVIPFTPSMNRVAEWLGLGGGRSRFWAHDRVLDVDTFRGACMLCRMEAVRQVGLMHTVSLAGGEETEWHYRFRKLGWRVTFYPEAEVVHLGQQTTGKVSSLRNERLKSLLYFFRQHGSKREFRIFCGLVWFALGWRWLWHSLRGRPEEAKIELEGMRIICRWMGSQCGSPDG